MPITFDCAALSCPWFPPDTTLLEIAAAHQIPTVSACGGNGMRNFTAITEACPAFDVVYILNRYFTTLKQAITRHGGQVNLYVGDEISAVFGMDTDPRTACRQAVDTGLEMLQRIETLSAVIEREFHVRLAIGVGSHPGLHIDPGQQVAVKGIQESLMVHAIRPEPDAPAASGSGEDLAQP